MKPDHRVHGVILGKDWLPNVIPDYAKMRWIKLSSASVPPRWATDCKVNVKATPAYYDLNQNPALAKEFSAIVKDHFQMDTTSHGSTASTDFGNVGYHIPSLHQMFAIPTEPNGGNHTAAFARSAATDAAHEAAVCVTQALALTAFRTISDDAFFQEIKDSFVALTNNLGSPAIFDGKIMNNALNLTLTDATLICFTTKVMTAPQGPSCNP
ncbi:hypothetical protein MPER_07000 [Moniliophthora perniciosa FA553]|nr:hypothetical protein MPER_07000 [Moniliophthora perniciosa FA553]